MARELRFDPRCSRLAPITVEGVLVVQHHPGWSEFAAVDEVLVLEVRRRRPWER
jgi:hypothetical protein